MSLSVKKIINDVIRVVDGATDELDSYELMPDQFNLLINKASSTEVLEQENKRYREQLESQALELTYHEMLESRYNSAFADLMILLNVGNVLPPTAKEHLVAEALNIVNSAINDAEVIEHERKKHVSKCNN